MRVLYRVMGSVFLFSMVPISILWVWFSQWWIQYLITDLILFASGMLTVAASIEQPVKPKPEENPLDHVRFTK